MTLDMFTDAVFEMLANSELNVNRAPSPLHGPENQPRVSRQRRLRVVDPHSGVAFRIRIEEDD